MHVYGMQQLIQERGKDEVINVNQRNSLYQTITRLEQEGLLTAELIVRDRNRPERTIYKLTATGKAAIMDWTRAILSTPSREFPEFPAAISVLSVLTPKDALKHFEARLEAIKLEVARLEAHSKTPSCVPRIFLLEMEYLQAQKKAELQWIQTIAADLREERLTWNKASIRKLLRSRVSPCP